MAMVELSWFDVCFELAGAMMVMRIAKDSKDWKKDISR